jgi:hypothetical protein|nr:MAG: hypothetical protein DIU61_10040 [Bacteroidota bacterium]
MKFLPFENTVYKTRLDVDEVKRRLGTILESERTPSVKDLFLRRGNHKPYQGRIVDNSFVMVRLIGYQNSFLPRIQGTIEKDIRGTKVNVKMRLNLFVGVFTLIWFTGAAIVGVSIMVSEANNQSFKPMSLMPLGMLLFGYALVTGAFKYESIKSKRHLAELLEAQMEG